MFTTTAQVLDQQRQTLARWRKQSALNAGDMASTLVMKFQRETANEIGDSFLWEEVYALATSNGCASRLAELFSTSLEEHFARTFKKLADELKTKLGDQAPDAYIYHTELDAMRREVALLTDSEAFKRALKLVWPGLIDRLTAPDIMDEAYEAWDKKLAKRAIDGLNEHVAAMESKLARTIEKILLDAADEYESGLNIAMQDATS